MKRLWIVVTIAIAVLAFGVSYAYTSKPVVEPAVTPYVAKVEAKPPTASEILGLVNAERAKIGVAALVVYENLVRSAECKAIDMDKFDYFGHQDKDNSGRKNGLDYLDSLMPGCSYIGENYQATSRASATSQTALDWWMNSPPHREALLSDKYSKTGIGVVYDESREYYIAVQHFCIAK